MQLPVSIMKLNFFKDIKIQRNDLLSEDLTDFNLANGDEMSIAGGKNRYALFGLFLSFEL